MRRFATAMLALVVPALVHLHLHLQRPQSFDYAGLAAAAFASWVGLPGPGEPLLLAAAVLAARNKLDLADVLLVAFLAAVAGGVAGWAIGLKAGRAVLTGRGPFRKLRIRVVERGEAIFDRHPVIAILMTPAFVAGVHRVDAGVYQAVNVASAAAWTLVLGVGGYFVGPPVLDAVGDLGTGMSIVVAAVVAAIIVLEVGRRYRKLSR
ncbi:MAG TPA: hypothetical protein VE127_02170 [Solirubrobacteraceae bacterium]|nr:hypothetical protein [Solirubrobacteraceae bacterium]